MIDAEVARYVQSEIDKRIAKVIMRLEALENPQKPVGVFTEGWTTADRQDFDPAVHMRKLLDESPASSPPEWSNHNPSHDRKWTRIDDTKLRNPIGIQWPIKLIVADGKVKDPMALSEIHAHDPNLYDELVSGIQLEHEQENPSRAADPGA
jgi:hypothetical protein